MSQELRSINTALISVSNKSPLLPLAKILQENNITILSSGGTADYLSKHNITVTQISDYTGFPELLAGRVKTLHPKIHAGILHHGESSQQELTAQNIIPIDLVIVDLYPFEKNPSIENIDIGGPTLLRGAAKNYQYITVIFDPNDYPLIIEKISNNKKISLSERKTLASKAFEYIARYDLAIANYFHPVLPQSIHLQQEKTIQLRYGENPSQTAAVYIPSHLKQPTGILQATQHQGKQLSYNNITDANAAIGLAQSFTQPACVIIKHATPCGVGVAQTIKEAYLKAYQADASSAYGGIICVNQQLDHHVALTILEQQFAEIIIAPDFTDQALRVFTDKKQLRILQLSSITNPKEQKNRYHLRSASDAILLQTQEKIQSTIDDYSIVTEKSPSAAQKTDLIFAWQVSQVVKSNAIVIAKHGQTIGIGAGQTSRLFSIEIAALKATQNKLNTHGAALASDGFFPFKDNVELAHKNGITSIIQPGGSKRDQEVIDTANQFDIAMIFTHHRCFTH